MFYYLYSQTVWLWTLRNSLWSRRLSSEVQPLTSETTGPESQWPKWFRSKAAVFWTQESKLSTGDSGVSSCVFSLCLLNLNLQQKFYISFSSHTHTHTHTHTQLSARLISDEDRMKLTVSQLCVDGDDSGDEDLCFDYSFLCVWDRAACLCWRWIDGGELFCLVAEVCCVIKWLESVHPTTIPTIPWEQSHNSSAVSFRSFPQPVGMRWIGAETVK